MSVSAETLRCALCGHELVPAALPCHSECPLGPRCGLICCPSCGYQVVDETRSLLGRLIRGRPLKSLAPGARPPGSATTEVPLTHVPQGTEVEIRSLRDMPSGRSARLSAFGVVPGTSVTLVQRRPVPVVRIGETDLALSEEILGEIWVSPRADRDSAGAD
jgi:Fe2+ transport system protein FeoA